MKIFLDDIRAPPPGWVLVQTSHEAIAALAGGGVTEISLDHDLGPPEAGTGYDVVLWIEQQVHRGVSPPKMYIHSANPVGRQRMQAGIDMIQRLTTP